MQLITLLNLKDVFRFLKNIQYGNYEAISQNNKNCEAEYV